MDPVPFVIATAVASCLVAAVVALWRKVNNREKREDDRNSKCEERGARLEAEVVATKALVIDIYRERAREADARADREARNALHMADAAKTVSRVLKRYENSPTPPPSTGETSALVPIVRH